MDFSVEHSMQYYVLGKLFLALLLGAAIGANREFFRKPAGIRTQMLVCGAAALLVSVGQLIIGKFGMNISGTIIRSDPLRLIEAVITGVAFIGAGTIIYHRENNAVEGLTTAATLLFSAVVGICIGFDQFIIGIGAGASAIFALIFFYKIDKFIHKQSDKNNIP